MDSCGANFWISQFSLAAYCYLDLVTDQGKGTLDRRLYELHARGVISVALRHELCIKSDMY